MIHMSTDEQWRDATPKYRATLQRSVLRAEDLLDMPVPAEVRELLERYLVADRENIALIDSGALKVETKDPT